MCPCLKEVPSYLSGFSAADFRTAASAGVGRLSACLVKQSFNVKNNLAELEQSGGDLSEADGDKIIRAPTVGLDLYINQPEPERSPGRPALPPNGLRHDRRRAGRHRGRPRAAVQNVPRQQFAHPNKLIPYIRIQGGAAK